MGQLSPSPRSFFQQLRGEAPAEHTLTFAQKPVARMRRKIGLRRWVLDVDVETVPPPLAAAVFILPIVKW